MATGQARLAGRFPPGSVVRLVKVASEATLRSEGGEEVDTQTVGDDGVVTFSKGVDVGGRYLAVGLVGGTPLEVRLRGNVGEDAVNGQAPVARDRVRLSDGSWADEAPKREKAPAVPPGPRLAQHQVPGDVPQRSATLRGTAHPVDPEEQEPVRRQEDVKDGTPQMSDTRPREVDGQRVGGGGEASEILVGPQRQEDVPDGVPQRSDTPTGVATPIDVGTRWRRGGGRRARRRASRAATGRGRTPSRSRRRARRSARRPGRTRRSRRSATPRSSSPTVRRRGTC
jgi:hypothetical protein